MQSELDTAIAGQGWNDIRINSFGLVEQIMRNTAPGGGNGAYVYAIMVLQDGRYFLARTATTQYSIIVKSPIGRLDYRSVGISQSLVQTLKVKINNFLDPDNSHI